MDKKREFTPAVWLEIQKLSVLGTWRYSKGIYTPHPSLLNALAETPLSDSLPVDVFLRFPEWCIYVSTPGMCMQGEELYGFWAMVNQNDVNNDKSLYLLLNREKGLKLESFRLKTGSVNAILEDMFYQGLDASGATPETVGALKDSEYLSAHLKSKARDAGRLLSILLYICSDEPEIDSERQPGSYPARPKPVKTKKGFRLFTASGPGTGVWGNKRERCWRQHSLKLTFVLQPGGRFAHIYGADTGMVSGPAKETNQRHENFHITGCRHRLLAADVIRLFTDSG